MREVKHTINQEILKTSVSSINKGLGLLNFLLDKKDDNETLYLIKKIKKDDNLYKWMNSNTKKSKDNKFTLNSILKSLSLLKKEAKKGYTLDIYKKTNTQTTKKEISNEDYHIVYFTWKNLTFTEKGVKVDPNIIYLSINIDGPTNILNNINVSYFQKKYSNDLYKVYINTKTKKILYNLSKDIEKIRLIVSNHINNNKDLQIKNSNSQEKVNQKNNKDFTESKEIKVNEIDNLFQNNKFIKQASKLLTNENKAIALWENNNSTLEESLLIILKHKEYNFVIWENINENRACYIFKYKTLNFDLKLNNLKKFINSSIKYKRWDLFNKNGNDNKLNYDEYFTVIHENEENYKNRLNTILHPFFKVN